MSETINNQTTIASSTVNNNNNSTITAASAAVNNAFKGEAISALAASLTQPLRVNSRMVLPFQTQVGTNNVTGDLQVTLGEVSKAFAGETPSLLHLQDFPTPKPDDGSFRGYMPFPDNPHSSVHDPKNNKIAAAKSSQKDHDTPAAGRSRKNSEMVVLANSNDGSDSNDPTTKDKIEQQEKESEAFNPNLMESTLAGGAPDIADLIVAQTQNNNNNNNLNINSSKLFGNTSSKIITATAATNNHQVGDGSCVFIPLEQCQRSPHSSDEILKLRTSSKMKEQLETGDDDGKFSQFLWSTSFGHPYRSQEELAKLPLEITSSQVRNQFKPSFYGPYLETLHLSTFNKFTHPEATTTFAAHCEAERLHAEGTRDWFAQWRSLVLATSSTASVSSHKCWNLSLSLMGARMLEIERFTEEFADATKSTASKIADQVHSAHREHWVLQPIGDGFEDVFVVDGVVYVVATSPRFASFYGGCHGAWKACHNELLAVRSLLGAMIFKNVVPPLMSVMERGGCCIFVSAPMPIVRRELVCGELGGKADVYAAEEGGLYSSYEIAEFFALQLHTIRINNLSGESVNIPTAADVKIFESRKYDCDLMIDCAKLWPTNVVPAQFARPSGSAAAGGIGAASADKNAANKTKSTVASPTTMTTPTTTTSSNAAVNPTSPSKVPLCRHDIDDVPGSHLYALFRPEFMRCFTPNHLNADIGMAHQAFSNYDNIGYNVAQSLFKVRLPACQQDLIGRAASGTLKEDGSQLSDILHSHGINFRYLGKIAMELELIGFRTTAEAAPARKAFQICVHEIACRSFVRLLRHDLRTQVGEFSAELLETHEKLRKNTKNTSSKLESEKTNNGLFQTNDSFNDSSNLVFSPSSNKKQKQPVNTYTFGNSPSNPYLAANNNNNSLDEGTIIVNQVKNFLRCTGNSSEMYWRTRLRTQMEDQFGCFYMPLKEVDSKDVASGALPTNLNQNAAKNNNNTLTSSPLNKNNNNTANTASSSSSNTIGDAPVYVSLNTGKMKAEVVQSSSSQWKESGVIPGQKTLIVTDETKDEADILRRSAVVALLGPGAFVNVNALLRVMKLAGFTVASDVRGRRLTASCNPKIRAATPLFVSGTLSALVEWVRNNENSDYLKWKQNEIKILLEQHAQKQQMNTPGTIRTAASGSASGGGKDPASLLPSAGCQSTSSILARLSLLARDRLGLCEVVEHAAKQEMNRYSENDARNCCPLWLLTLAQFGRQNPGPAYVSASRWGAIRANAIVPIAQCVSQLYCSQLMEEMNRLERAESLAFEGLFKLAKILPREDPETLAWAVYVVGLQLFRSAIRSGNAATVAFAASTNANANVNAIPSFNAALGQSAVRRIQRALDYFEHALRWADPRFTGLQFHRLCLAAVCILRHHVLIKATCCKCSTPKDAKPASQIRVDKNAVSETAANDFLATNSGGSGGGGGGGNYSPDRAGFANTAGGGGGAGGAGNRTLGGGSKGAGATMRNSPPRRPASSQKPGTTRLGEEALRQVSGGTSGAGGIAMAGGFGFPQNHRSSMLGSISSHIAGTSVAEEEEDLFVRVSLPPAATLFNGVDGDATTFVPRVLSTQSNYKTLNTFAIKAHPLCKPSSLLLKGITPGVTLLLPTRYYCESCARKESAVKAEYQFEPLMYELSVLLTRCVASFDSDNSLISTGKTNKSSFDYYFAENNNNNNNKIHNHNSKRNNNNNDDNDDENQKVCENLVSETKLLQLIGDDRFGLVLRHAGVCTGSSFLMSAAVEELVRVWGNQSYLCNETRTAMSEILLERSEITVAYSKEKSRDLPMVITADDTLRGVLSCTLRRVEEVLQDAMDHPNMPVSSSDLAALSPADDTFRIPNINEYFINELIPRVVKRLQFILNSIYSKMPTAKRELEVVHFLLDATMRHLGKSHPVTMVAMENLICFYLQYLEQRASQETNVLNLAGTLKMIGQYVNMWLSGTIQTSNAKLASTTNPLVIQEEEKSLVQSIDGLISVMREGVLRRLRRANTLSDRVTMLALSDELRTIVSRAPMQILNSPQIVGNMSLLDDFVAGATGQQQQHGPGSSAGKKNNSGIDGAGGDGTTTTTTFLTSGTTGKFGQTAKTRGLTSAATMTHNNNNAGGSGEDDVGAGITRAAMEEIFTRREAIIECHKNLLRHSDRTDLYANSLVKKMDEEIRKLRRIGASWHKKDIAVSKAAMACYPLADTLLKRTRKPDAYYKNHSAGLNELASSNDDNNNGGENGTFSTSSNTNSNGNSNAPYVSPYEALESNREQPTHVQETMIAHTLRALRQPAFNSSDQKPKQLLLPPMPRSEAVFEHLMTSTGGAHNASANNAFLGGDDFYSPSKNGNRSNNNHNNEGLLDEAAVTKIKKLFPKVVASGASLNFSNHAVTANNITTATSTKRAQKNMVKK